MDKMVCVYLCTTHGDRFLFKLYFFGTRLKGFSSLNSRMGEFEYMTKREKKKKGKVAFLRWNVFDVAFFRIHSVGAVDGYARCDAYVTHAYAVRRPNVHN